MPQWKRNDWHWAYLQIPALSSLRVSLPNLVPLHIGMWGWKTTLWLVRCPLEPYGSSFHKHGSRCTTEKTMKRVPIFVLLPFQCYAFIWNEYLISFFFYLFRGESTAKWQVTIMYSTVILSSVSRTIEILMLKLLMIICLNSHRDMFLHDYMSSSYPSNSGYLSSCTIQFKWLLPLSYCSHC